MSYIVDTYLITGCIFSLSTFVQFLQLVYFNKALPVTLKYKNSQREMQNMLDELELKFTSIPEVIAHPLLVLGTVLFSMLFGFSWIVTPIHRLRALVELLLWEFKEV